MPFEMKFSHSAVRFKDSIVIYGGNKHGKTCRVVNFDLVKLRMTEIECTSEYLATWRKGHVCQAFGRAMIVYGGMNLKGDLITDLIILDMLSWEWIVPEVKKKEEWPKLYGSASCCVLSEPRMKEIFKENYSCYKLPKFKLDKEKEVKHEGLYMFGGRLEDDSYNTDLLVIRVGSNPLKLLKPAVTGKPPAGTINCSLDYLTNCQMLVLHGGLSEGKSYESKDFYTLCLIRMSWCRVVLDGDEPVRRQEHVSAAYKGKIIVFGGISDNKIVGSDFYELKFM